VGVERSGTSRSKSVALLGIKWDRVPVRSSGAQKECLGGPKKGGTSV
jgi:hypothetical protein